MGNKKVLLTSIILGILGVFFLFIIGEQAANNAKAKEADVAKKQLKLINDAYIMGAIVYRAQALMLVEDSIITRMDTLFIQETRDINDSLAVEALHEIAL